MVWMYREISCHGRQKNNSCTHVVPGNWGAPKLNGLCLNSMADDCSLCLLRQLIALFVALLSWLKVSRFSLLELLSMEFGQHNLFSDMSFGGPIIHLVRIQFSVDSKIWELRPLWISAVHGWAGVASHLAESLSRISFLRFSLLSFHSSFDRARTCRSYLRIWKHWSKHTTQSISS